MCVQSNFLKGPLPVEDCDSIVNGEWSPTFEFVECSFTDFFTKIDGSSTVWLSSEEWNELRMLRTRPKVEETSSHGYVWTFDEMNMKCGDINRLIAIMWLIQDLRNTWFDEKAIELASQTFQGNWLLFFVFQLIHLNLNVPTASLW